MLTANSEELIGSTDEVSHIPLSL